MSRIPPGTNVRNKIRAKSPTVANAAFLAARLLLTRNSAGTKIRAIGNKTGRKLTGMIVTRLNQDKKAAASLKPQIESAINGLPAMTGIQPDDGRW
jgi:hypothetical protein